MGGVFSGEKGDVGDIGRTGATGAAGAAGAAGKSWEWSQLNEADKAKLADMAANDSDLQTAVVNSVVNKKPFTDAIQAYLDLPANKDKFRGPPGINGIDGMITVSNLDNPDLMKKLEETAYQNTIATILKPMLAKTEEFQKAVALLLSTTPDFIDRLSSATGINIKDGVYEFKEKTSAGTAYLKWNSSTGNYILSSKGVDILKYSGEDGSVLLQGGTNANKVDIFSYDANGNLKLKVKTVTGENTILNYDKISNKTTIYNLDLPSTGGAWSKETTGNPLWKLKAPLLADYPLNSDGHQNYNQVVIEKDLRTNDVNFPSTINAKDGLKINGTSCIDINRNVSVNNMNVTGHVRVNDPTTNNNAISLYSDGSITATKNLIIGKWGIKQDDENLYFTYENNNKLILNKDGTLTATNGIEIPRATNGTLKPNLKIGDWTMSHGAVTGVDSGELTESILLKRLGINRSSIFKPDGNWIWAEVSDSRVRL
jgi:hypothetical protein